MCLIIFQDLTFALYEHLQQIITSNVRILGIDLDSTLICRAQEKIKEGQEISFKCVDIMNNSQKIIIENYLTTNSSNQNLFDVIFCFSTSMWIHLNYGDSGLKTFLKFICEKTKMIVIEPQPWKCYKTAVKRLKLANDEFPYFKELQIRTDIEYFIEEFILKYGFNKIHESPSSEWGRKILFFTKNND